MPKTVNLRNQGLVLFSPYVGSLSGATAPGQSEPGSEGNEGVLRIPQSCIITGTSPSDLFSVISRTLIGRRSYPFAEKQSVYFTASTDWASLI